MRAVNERTSAEGAIGRPVALLGFREKCGTPRQESFFPPLCAAICTQHSRSRMRLSTKRTDAHWKELQMNVLMEVLVTAMQLFSAGVRLRPDSVAR